MDVQYACMYGYVCIYACSSTRFSRKLTALMIRSIISLRYHSFHVKACAAFQYDKRFIPLSKGEVISHQIFQIQEQFPCVSQDDFVFATFSSESKIRSAC